MTSPHLPGNTRGGDDDLLLVILLGVLLGATAGLMVAEGFYAIAAGFFTMFLMLALLGIRGEIQRSRP